MWSDCLCLCFDRTVKEEQKWLRPVLHETWQSGHVLIHILWRAVTEVQRMMGFHNMINSGSKSSVGSTGSCLNTSQLPRQVNFDSLRGVTWRHRVCPRQLLLCTMVSVLTGQPSLLLPGCSSRTALEVWGCKIALDRWTAMRGHFCQYWPSKHVLIQTVS